jgi:uncharacterized repeat protein (TIGR01451 family)
MQKKQNYTRARQCATLLFAIGTVSLNAVAGPTAFAQGNRPFNIRFDGAFRGDIVLVGNNLLACQPGTFADVNATRCEDAQSGSATSGIDNNVFDMRHVDIDGDSSTFNSSSAVLSVPAGAQVNFAGLYWGAFSDATSATLNPARNSVKLRAPNSAGYVSVTASQMDDVFIYSQGNAYQGFADITPQVKAAGAGAYMVADVFAIEGKNRYAGWAMVVAYASPGEALRNMVIYDGFKYDPEFKPVNIPLSDFITPASGPVTATLGVYGSDGDRGNPGDVLLLNNTVISDAVNPPNNPFNSSISIRGVNIDTRTPAAVNNMNIDVDLFDASNILPNNAVSAMLTISATQEKFLPALVTFSTLVFQPALEMETRVSDLNGGEVKAGDTLEYTILMTNTGDVAAADARLSVALPAGAAYVPNTINIISNAGGATGAQTDAAGDDLAEVSGGALAVRLGAGASAAAGGDMATGASASVKYQVKVPAAIAHQVVLTNKADVNFRSAANLSVGLTSTSVVNVMAFPRSRQFLPMIFR